MKQITRRIGGGKGGRQRSEQVAWVGESGVKQAAGSLSGELKLKLKANGFPACDTSAQLEQVTFCNKERKKKAEG